eukprot:scaffold25_cov190-Alexandrium_tamarense.AAC.25
MDNILIGWHKDQVDDVDGCMVNRSPKLGFDFADLMAKAKDEDHEPQHRNCYRLSSPDNNNSHVQRRVDYSKRTISLSDSFIEIPSNIEPSTNSDRCPSWFYLLNDVRKKIGRVVKDDRVQNIVLLLIVINAIMMGVATFPFVRYNPDLSARFELVDLIFLILFTVESGLQLMYHGWRLFKDGFLVFDLAIVVMSWALDGAQVARAFRIFRALRLITRIKAMRELVQALFNVISKMTAIGMLLFLMFYIFGVMFTQLYKDVSKAAGPEENFFVGLPETFFTLFVMMTLDNWSAVYEQVAAVYSWSWVLFITFISLAASIFVNLIIAVICDAVHELTIGDKAKLHGMQVKQSSDGIETSPTNTSTTQPKSSTVQRIRELEEQLDEIVLCKNICKGQ